MTDNLDELVAEARRQVSAWEEKFGPDDRGVTWASLAGRLADAVVQLQRERDGALAVIERAEDYITRHYFDTQMGTDVLTLLVNDPADALRAVKAEALTQFADEYERIHAGVEQVGESPDYWRGTEDAHGYFVARLRSHAGFLAHGHEGGSGMTLDDETAGVYDPVGVMGTWTPEEVKASPVGASRLIQTLAAEVKAGYASRDAEVEELRADLDAAAYRAGQYQARIARAEATLAKAREWAERCFRGSRDGMDGRTDWEYLLSEILDESPTDVATALTGASDLEKIGPDFATSPTEREPPAKPEGWARCNVNEFHSKSAAYAAGYERGWAARGGVR